MRVLVVTIVHHPLDARIHRRQIGALRSAGVDVTYAAPWTAAGESPPDDLRTLDLPRAEGRRRLGAIRRARSLVRHEAPEHDVVLVHDVDLLPAVAGVRGPAVVWDVHEDTAAALADRAWVPALLSGPARTAVRRAERWAERRLHLLLAEDGYRDRFNEAHPVVPNVPLVPSETVEPGDDRVVHVGRLSNGRGWPEILALARRLKRSEIAVELVGPADEDIAAEVRAAASSGLLTWHGFVPNARALQMVAGSLAGLSLLHDLPNYRHSLPTKIAEYLAAGVPVVATPLPVARDLVERSGGGVIVPFGDIEAAALAIEQLRDDEVRRASMGADGHQFARSHLNWEVEGRRFVETLLAWAPTG